MIDLITQEVGTNISNLDISKIATSNYAARYL